MWLYTPHVKKGLSKKFAKMWSGPFVVDKKIGDVNYELKWESDKEKKKMRFHQRVHVS